MSQARQGARQSSHHETAAPGTPSDGSSTTAVRAPHDLDAYARALQDCDDIASVAELMIASLRTQGVVPTCVAWSPDWPRNIQFHPLGACSESHAGRLRAAVAAVRNGAGTDAQVHVLCDDDSRAVAAVMVESWDGGRAGSAMPVVSDVVDAILTRTGRRMASLLDLKTLRATVERLEQAERLQRALFAIADLAGSNLDMPAMLQGLHRIVGELMYAENFFIATYVESSDTIRFIYFADSEDMDVPDAEGDIPLDDIRHGPTWWLVRGGEALRGSDDELRAQLPGPLEMHGADSADWLGVPMRRDGQIQGALVVQSYKERVRYSAADQALLAFVAEHILTALERKRSQEELERHVALRTEQLANANEVLRQQITERERAEHLQATLYRIAALANTDESSDRFYHHVHAAVGELLNAQNFYIALLSADGTQLEFPYYVDASSGAHAPRPLGRGLSELVIRRGSTLLVDREVFAQLVAAGEVETSVQRGSNANCWIGAPLLDSERVIGVVAIQSYSAQDTYDRRDAELLTFVSYQIANSLQRRKSAEALLQMNAELEGRVEERTRELREQITVREQVEAQLKHQVMHDALTGLPNRLYLRDRIERAIAARKRDAQRQFALLYLDVDRFKVINDSLGHLAGDEVLREVAQRLVHCVREPDVVARLSGDEFAILLEDVPVPKTATRIAQRILQSLQEPMHAAGRDLQSSASIGIAIGDARHERVDSLLHDADTALYRAKSSGRQRFVLFDDSLQREAMDVLGIENELRLALARNEFEPYFQPLVRLDDGSRVGYEALVRWNHPQRGVLAPGEFLPIAEESGLIEAIDWQMYRMACSHGAPLVADGGFITINVSPRHFQDEDLDASLLQLTKDTGIAPSSLRIEVTEGTLLGDPEAVATILQRLRDACIDAALDDFGTGYSSLGYVHQFPLKMLKIDRSFIEPLGREGVSRSSAVVSAILALSHSLGLEVIAEGIETELQRDALKSMGCVHGQGYLFGRPQPASHWLQGGT